MVRERKTRNIKKLLSKKAPLPTKTEVNNSVAKITGQKKEVETSVKSQNISTNKGKKNTITEKIKLESASNPPIVKRRERGRPKRGHGRVKFTTILDPLKRDELKILAIHQGRSVTDILDEIIEDYLKKHRIS